MRRTLSTFEIDAILRAIAHRQLGLVTVSQAAAAGIDGGALHRRREAGALVPVFAGVMRLGAVAPTPQQRILAGSLAVPRSMVAATSAAVVHAMPLPSHFVAPTASPIVAVSAGRSTRLHGVIAIRHSFQLPDQPWVATRVATPSATLLLLPRFLDDRLVERCLDHSLAHRLSSVAGMCQLLEQVPSRAVQGRALLSDLLAQRSTGMGHRSGLEQQVGRWLHDAGLRGWKANFRVQVSGGRSVEVDFAWSSQKVALEVSPFFTHGARSTQERDVERRRLLVECGWRTAEAADPDLESRLAFARTVATLRTLLSGPSQAFLSAG